ncbi:MAG: hypothetical protein JNJ60_09040, partial [Rhodocyclaceae bacterium]|nr:hypothetical protein [Rhodocyclaceae bacterium]
MPPSNDKRLAPAAGARQIQASARGLLLYCREGFEKECAQELSHTLAHAEWQGYCVARPASALVQWIAHDASLPDTRPPALSKLVFARQLLLMGAELRELEPGRRVEEILAAAAQLAPAYSGMVVETAYTDAARELSALARSLAPALSHGAAAADLIRPQAGLPRLHVLLDGGSAAIVAAALPG